MRKEIKDFAEEMERIMAFHDEEKGDSWKNPDEVNETFLWGKLREEFIECMHEEAPPEELADLANICMILWNRGKLK